MRAIRDEKVRYKMYKSGKTWVIVGLTLSTGLLCNQLKVLAASDQVKVEEHRQLDAPSLPAIETVTVTPEPEAVTSAAVVAVSPQTDTSSQTVSSTPQTSTASQVATALSPTDADQPAQVSPQTDASSQSTELESAASTQVDAGTPNENATNAPASAAQTDTQTATSQPNQTTSAAGTDGTDLDSDAEKPISSATTEPISDGHAAPSAGSQSSLSAASSQATNTSGVGSDAVANLSAAQSAETSAASEAQGSLAAPVIPNEAPVTSMVAVPAEQLAESAINVGASAAPILTATEGTDSSTKALTTAEQADVSYYFPHDMDTWLPDENFRYILLQQLKKYGFQITSVDQIKPEMVSKLKEFQLDEQLQLDDRAYMEAVLNVASIWGVQYMVDLEKFDFTVSQKALDKWGYQGAQRRSKLLDITALRMKPKLKALIVRGTSVNRLSLDQLQILHNLEFVDLSNNQIASIDQLTDSLVDKGQSVIIADQMITEPNIKVHADPVTGKYVTTSYAVDMNGKRIPVKVGATATAKGHNLDAYTIEWDQLGQAGEFVMAWDIPAIASGINANTFSGSIVIPYETDLSYGNAQINFVDEQGNPVLPSIHFSAPIGVEMNCYEIERYYHYGTYLFDLMKAHEIEIIGDTEWKMTDELHVVTVVVRPAQSILHVLFVDQDGNAIPDDPVNMIEPADLEDMWEFYVVDESDYFKYVSAELDGKPLAVDENYKLEVMYTKPVHNLILTFKRKLGNVTLHYVDQNNQPIAEKEVVQGLLNTDFTITPQPIPGYKLVMTEGDLSGQFTGTDTGITFTYEKDEDFAAPGEPETPEQPGEPEQPSEPQEPETPEQPGEPQEPETPEQPGEPQEPETPEQPGEPQEPETPEQPGEPQEPETPEQPGEPEEPGQPGEPQEPEQPGESEQPGTSEQPTDSEQPAQPAPSDSTGAADQNNDSAPADDEAAQSQQADVLTDLDAGSQPVAVSAQHLNQLGAVLRPHFGESLLGHVVHTAANERLVDEKSAMAAAATSITAGAVTRDETTRDEATSKTLPQTDEQATSWARQLGLALLGLIGATYWFRKRQ
ncbi:MucBP domain-containing protein [Lactiplantibacillus modestisalitolerans]|uniref:MucBP domain-containing protein n=1 Tax=Lactiplantibacillus modestisalitolerans TaxID=1457219 RepID=A0ABV5WXB1_9LACO|nr:MucBP domain-containing protein [Lactiplantibacillus modestisalitolerans]